MTLGKMLPHLGTKDITERVNAEYHSSPAHSPQLYYSYEPPVHVHSHAASKHHHGYGGGGGKKNNAAMSALTLLAFLFFLHILQQCLREHMQGLAAPQLLVMSAARDHLSPLDKMDKSGAQKETRRNEHKTDELTKLPTTQYTPKTPTKYVAPFQKYQNVTYTDFV